jgi:hypothetical protein
VEEEIRRGVALLRSKSGSCVTGSVPFPLKTGTSGCWGLGIGYVSIKLCPKIIKLRQQNSSFDELRGIALL